MNLITYIPISFLLKTLKIITLEANSKFGLFWKEISIRAYENIIIIASYTQTYLTIEGCWIMSGPEKREEVTVGANRRIELDPNHLDVVSNTGANQFVIRVVRVTLRVPNLCLHNAFHSLERQLYTPEAPGRELGELQTRSIRIGQIRIKCRIGGVGVLCFTGSHDFFP